MSSKVLEVTSMKAPNGWNWMLRAYSVVPFWSRAVGCVMCGNLQLLQDMFASGQASPFDQVEDTNYSLLHVSITYNWNVSLTNADKILSGLAARTEAKSSSSCWVKGQTQILQIIYLSTVECPLNVRSQPPGKLPRWFHPCVFYFNISTFNMRQRKMQLNMLWEPFMARLKNLLSCNNTLALLFISYQNRSESSWLFK